MKTTPLLSLSLCAFASGFNLADTRTHHSFLRNAVMAAGRPRVAASQGALQTGQAMRRPIHSAPMALFAAPINPSDARDANEAPRQYRSPNTESFSRSALEKAKQLSIRSDYYGLSKYFLGIKKDPQKQQVAVALLDLWVTQGGGALNRAGLFISLLDPTGEYHEWFADHLYEKDVNVLGRYIHQLKLSDAILEGLVQKLFETDPDILLRHINSFIPDKDTRTTMLPLLIEKAPATFFNCCEHLKLSEQALHAYAEKYYLKAPREFAKQIRHLKMSVAQRTEYAVKLAEHNPDVLRDHLKFFYSQSMSESSQEAILQNLFQKHLPNKERWLSGVVDYPVLDAFLNMGCWIDTAVSINGCPLLSHDKTAELIQSVATLDNPELAKKTLSAFEHVVLGPKICQSEFVELTGSLSRYGLVQSLYLHNIIQNSDLCMEEKKCIIQDYGNKGFKNAFKLSKLLDFLIRLEALGDRPELQSQLLLATCPSVEEPGLGKKHVLPKLMMNTNLMQVLIQFDQMDDGLFSLSRAIDLDIEGVKTASQLLKAVKMLAVFLLGQEGSKESVEAIERYFTRVENPSALLIWATRQHEFAIKSPAPGRLNLPLMEKVSSWLIYDDQLSRYAEHPMLPGLKAKNEQAFQRWCARDIPQDLVVTPNTLRSKVDYSAYNDLNDGVEIEFEDLHEVDELEALDKLLRLCDRGDWKARVTANLEDIFMCGTSIPGSCQHVNTQGVFNQGLIGYMQYAKMVGIWKGDKLFGRNMLFLGWDQAQQKHVLLMAANSYGQPECDAGFREVMKLACKDYADWLGLELLDSSGGLNDPFNLSGSTAVRKVDIKLGVPTYFDGLGNCSDDITLYVYE